MKDLRIVLIAATFLILPVQSEAQHHPASDAVIDGAVHPELISDSTAYRLFFLAVARAPNTGSSQDQSQFAFLSASGLNDKEIQAAIPILANFKVEYTRITNHYNDLVKRAESQGMMSLDVKTFVQQRDALVQITRGSLASALTPHGLQKLDAHVQREKKRMTVAKELQ